MTIAQYDIVITDDNILEENEILYFAIAASILPMNVSVGTLNQTRMIVMDDDCKLHRL